MTKRDGRHLWTYPSTLKYPPPKPERDEFECPACGEIFTALVDEEVICPNCDCIVSDGE